jgi:Flp pilus assembly protein TadD
VYRAQGRYEEAIAAYRTATSIDASLGEAWSGLGAAYLGLRKFDDALAAARQGMAHVPGEADSYLAVAILAPSEAPAVLAKAAEAVPDDARVHAALAETWLDAGDGRAAKAAAETAIRIDPTRNDARLSLLFAEAMAARTLDGQGYKDLVEARGLEGVGATEALVAYDGLVGRYPKCSLTYMGRARVRAASGDRDGAIADLSKAVSLDPDNIEAMAVYGLVLLEAGRASEARPMLDRAAADRPYDASLALASASARARVGDKAGALTALAAAAEMHPYDARVLLAYAKALAEAGKATDAYAVLRGGVDRLPGDDRLVLALAAAAKQVGRVDEAADLIDVLAKRSGSAELAEIARKLRSGEL